MFCLLNQLVTLGPFKTVQHLEHLTQLLEGFLKLADICGPELELNLARRIGQLFAPLQQLVELLSIENEGLSLRCQAHQVFFYIVNV